MEALGSILGPLFTTGGGISKLFTGGLLGAGEIGNIIEQRKKAEYQNRVMDLINNPAKLSRIAAAGAAPLSQGLIQNVGNTVQGQMAERGLAQAPGIFAATESQALAPFEQQNQQVALDAFLRALGIPASTFGPAADNSGAMKLFLDALKGPTQSSNVPFTPTGGSFPQAGPVNPFPTGIIPDIPPQTFDPSIFTTGLPGGGS